MERHCRGPKCLFKSDRDGRDQVRCNICIIWHHIDCVNVKEEEMVMSWTCFECRDLPKDVKSLQTEIAQLKNNQQSLMDMMTKATRLFEAESQLRVKAEQELSGLKSQLTALSEQLSNQQAELMQQLISQSQTNQAIPPPSTPPGIPPLTPSAPPMTRLLIGTSLLRNVDPCKLNNWEVIAKGGASVTDLHHKISNLPAEKQYSEMIVIGGSIDLESKEVTEIVTDYRALTVTASSKADKISISSVLPRTDKQLKEKTKSLNDNLKEMCERDGFTFIDNEPNFHLMNGNINEAFLTNDGLHLNKHGVDSLLHTCDVIRDGSAFSSATYPKSQNANSLYFRGHKDPLSNFFEATITYKGKQFKTSEAAYQHAKAEAMRDYRAATKIMKAKTGLHAMRIAQRITTNELWQQKKTQVMENIIKEKLKSNETVKSTLLESGSKEIIEDTSHEFWGRGKTGKGANKLGKIWMDFRKKCQENPNFLIMSDRPQQPRHRHTPQQPREFYKPKLQRFSKTVPQSRNWATREQQPRCYQCGEAGHGIRQCRKQDLVSCWACGQAGHKRKHCDYYVQESQSYYDNYYDYSY